MRADDKMKTSYVRTASIVLGLVMLAGGAILTAGQLHGGDRYKMFSTTNAASNNTYLVDGKTGRTWQLVTVQDDPTGSSDFWSPIDRFDTREGAAKRLDELSAGVAANPQEPIRLENPPATHLPALRPGEAL
jgi:hypothetical protein